MVPPPERGRVVVRERHVVEVVVVGAGPEGEDVLERPGEVVARVGVDGLEEAEGDPDVHGRDVEIAAGVDRPQDRAQERAERENERLERVGVFRRQAERRAVFVVEFVDVAVEGAVVESLVGEEVIEVFEDEEAGYLEGRGLPAREGDLPCLHTKVFGERVEEPYSWEFDGEVREQNELGAFPLLLLGRNFVWL